MEDEIKQVPLVITKTGEVALKENIDIFKEHVEKGLAECDPSSLVTDEDFENGKLLTKVLSKYREQIKVGIDALDVENIREVKAILMDLDKKIQVTSSGYTKAIKSRKEDIINEMRALVWDDVSSIDSKFNISQRDFDNKCNELLKGKSSFANMKETLNAYKSDIASHIKQSEAKLEEVVKSITDFFNTNGVIQDDWRISDVATRFVKDDCSEEEIQGYLERTKLEQEELAHKIKMRDTPPEVAEPEKVEIAVEEVAVEESSTEEVDMVQQEKAEVMIDMLLPIQEKMMEMDIKEFETTADDIKISIVLTKIESEK